MSLEAMVVSADRTDDLSRPLSWIFATGGFSRLSKVKARIAQIAAR